MNYSIVSKMLGLNLLVISMIFLICFGVSFFIDASNYQQEWITSFFITLFFAITLYLVGKRGNSKLLRKEAMAIVGLSWIFSILMGAIPYVLIIESSIADAIFESTAGLTTTGSSVFSELEKFPKSLMFWRCISQWLGGLGMVVFFVFILAISGSTGKFLFANESSLNTRDFGLNNLMTVVIKIIGLFVGLSMLCMVSYKWAGMNWFDSLCHSFTTVATGGFSTYSNSMGHFQNPLIEWICIVFMLLGGTSFLFILNICSLKKGVWKQATEIYTYYGIFLIVTFLIAVNMVIHDTNNTDLATVVRESTFQVASLITSTGYSSVDYELWVPAQHILLLIVMIIGGCSGSTAGGTKVIRVVIAVKSCINHIEKIFRPNVVRAIYVNNRIITKEEKEDNLYYLLILTGICLISLPLFGLLEPLMSSEGIKACVIASAFNIGPGFAEVGATDNYGFLKDSSKIFLSVLMLIGRLEIYAIVSLFVPSFWRRFK